MSEIRELQGLECKVNGVDAYVVHADRELGITIHSIGADEEVACLNRQELLYLAKQFKWRGANRAYHEAFTKIVSDIRNGAVINNIAIIPVGTKGDIEWFQCPVGSTKARMRCAYK